MSLIWLSVEFPNPCSMHAGEDEVLWVPWLMGSFDETVPRGGLS